MITISFLFFNKKDEVQCQYCGYKIVKPYPKDQLCPRCHKFLVDLFKYVENEEEIESKPRPKEIEKKTVTAASKLKGKVRVKKQLVRIDVNSDQIDLQKGEYLKFIGITSKERTPLYNNNKKYIYFLELANNLDFIATSILGGELDRMLLISSNKREEKAQFFIKDNIIYLIYGMFPDKKGKWLLEQIAKHFSELVKGKDVNNLDKLEKYNIESRFNGVAKFILEEYLKLQEVFSDQEIPFVEDRLRVDYIGLSSKSIGVISLLLGDELEVKVPGTYDNPEEENEMKESVLTAKIEALAANTLGNTGALPRWIAVKLGFQRYRFITFKEFQNNYYLSILSEGNLYKLNVVEDFLDPYLQKVVDTPFMGNLKPFNDLKKALKEILEKSREFK